VETSGSDGNRIAVLEQAVVKTTNEQTPNAFSTLLITRPIFVFSNLEQQILCHSKFITKLKIICDLGALKLLLKSKLGMISAFKLIGQLTFVQI
jgi:hypothetical protein